MHNDWRLGLTVPAGLIVRSKFLAPVAPEREPLRAQGGPPRLASPFRPPLFTLKVGDSRQEQVSHLH